MVWCDSEPPAEAMVTKREITNVSTSSGVENDSFPSQTGVHTQTDAITLSARRRVERLLSLQKCVP